MTKAKVLLAEDDLSLSFVIKDNLQDAGYEVFHFPDGEQAWQQFQKKGFDICLLDINMPVRDGFSLAKPGIVKAWHYHKKQEDNFTCVHGKMRLALYDARKSSPTYGEVNDFVMSLDDPMLVTIPKNVYHGFKCVSDCEAVVINNPTNMYNHKVPDEYRLDAYDNDIPYDWRK